MSSITTRVTAGSGATVKNAPLTNAEIDNNFINLNVDKAELASAQSFTAAQTFTAGLLDSAGSIRDIPYSGTAKTASYILQASDVGQLIVLGTGGSATIPNSIFSAGNAVTIYNSTNAAITITCSITTAYISGTFTDKATVSLRAAGLMTVLFINGTYCVLSGSIS